MDITRYGVRIHWSDEDGGYIALSPDLMGVSAFGETMEEALRELRTAQHLALEEILASGRRPPTPQALPSHSGQFRLRLPGSLHDWLVARAEMEGVSLNTLVVQLLGEARGAARAASAPLEESAHRR